MSPIATHTQGDSFTPTTNGGAATAVSTGDVNVHATARRSPPGGLFKVEGEQTKYDDAKGEIRSRFVDRGAEVTSESSRGDHFESFRRRTEGIDWTGLLVSTETPEGQLSVKRTERVFEFKTNTKVGKVG